MRKKELVILKSGGGELANQLWNYVSIYAYALYIGAKVYSPSFFEYHRYFVLWQHERTLTQFFSFWFQGPIHRRSHPVNRFWRRIYAIYANTIKIMHRADVYSSENQESRVTYLPPTATGALPEASTLYFEGWLFRNPVGLQRFRDQLRITFAPAPVIQNRIETLLDAIRQPDKHFVGIHLRQGDYRIFKDGKYLLSPERMREVIDEYLHQKQLQSEDVIFFIASDGPVLAKVFAGLTVHISQENAVIDLFMLSNTETIIGSNSSFGHFAAWYGNIPHIVATAEPMDWSYYADKSEYFENKYCTLARL